MTLFTIMAELALDVSKFNASAKAAAQAGQALGSDVANGAGKAASALEDTGKAAEKASTQVLNLSTGSVKALSKLEKSIMATEDILGDLPENFDGVVDSAMNNLNAVRKNGGLTLDEMKESISGINDALDAVDPGTKLDSPEVAKATEALEKYRDELQKIVKAADSAAESNKKMGDEAEKASKKKKKSGGNGQESGLFGTITKSLLTKEAIVRAGRAIVNFGKESVQAAAEISDFGSAYKSAVSDFDQNMTRMKASIGERLLPTIISVTSALNNMFPKESAAAQYQSFLDGVQKSLASNLLTLTASKQNVDGYISRLAELEKKSQWTTQDSTEWKANIDALLEVAPELSAYIDQQTGKIEGGTTALKAHAEAWYQDAEAQAKAAAITQIMTDATNKQADAMIAYWDYKTLYDEWLISVDELKAAQEELKGISPLNVAAYKAATDKVMELSTKEQTLSASAVSAQHSMEDANAAAAEATARAQEGVDAIKSGDYGLQQFGSTAEETGETLDNTVSPSLQTFRDKLKEQEKALHDAHKASEDYAKGIKEKVLSALDSVYDGYSKVSRIRPTSAKSQNQNAQAQMKQLQDYMDGLEKLREMGVDENLIAELSDGSQASMGRVAGLAKSKQSDIETYVATLKELQEMKDSVSEATADNVLKIDPAYQTLLDTEKQALQDLYDAAFALQDFEGGPTITVDDQASSVLEGIQSRMNALTGGTITIKVTPISDTTIPDGKYRNISSRAVGIDSVPYDGFLASLHEGEAILTKAENRQRKSRAGVGDQPINLTVNVNGSSRPYEVGQEVRNALENLRWFG
jgi:hypothetical protein